MSLAKKVLELIDKLDKCDIIPIDVAWSDEAMCDDFDEVKRLAEQSGEAT